MIDDVKLMYSEAEVEKIKLDEFNSGFSTGTTLIVLQHLCHVHADNPVICGELIKLRKAMGDP